MIAMPSNGQKTAKATYELSDTGAAISVWLLLDTTTNVSPTRADNRRDFPFDTSGTTLDLFFRGYGVALKTDATFTSKIAAHDFFKATGAANEVPNAFATSSDYALPVAYGNAATFAGESSQASGVVSFKLAATTWGGSCCEGNTCVAAAGANGNKQ